MSLIPINDEAFRAAVKKDVAKESQFVLDGRCTTFEDYKHRTGMIKGYEHALAHFKEALKADDDDD